MKSFNMQLSMSLLALSVFASCGSVPKGYQGTFQDSQSQALLILKSKGGQLNDENGQTLMAKAFALKYKDLDAGKSGIYVHSNQKDEKVLDVFWIQPVMASRQEEAGLVWYSADIAHTYFDSRNKSKDQVSVIELVRCRQGRVMLDPATQRWQVGCGEDIKVYEFQRRDSLKDLPLSPKVQQYLNDDRPIDGGSHLPLL